jgi:hypothetical protein
LRISQLIQQLILADSLVLALQEFPSGAHMNRMQDLIFGYGVAGKFFRIFALVGILCILTAAAIHGRSDQAPPDFNVQISIRGIPDCSYGYGQCRKSCDRVERSGLTLNQKALEECLEDCYFLYGGCRPVDQGTLAGRSLLDE